MNWKYAALSVFLTGCAGMEFETVKIGEDDSSDGIRYYEPSPFLLVYSDAKGHLESEIVFLPDTTTIRSVDPYAIMAKNNSVLNFSNGMLTSSESTVNETLVPEQIFKSISAIAGTVAGAAFDTPREFFLPSPRLYRIILTEHGAKLAGGPALYPNGDEVLIRLNKVAHPGGNN